MKDHVLVRTQFKYGDAPRSFGLQIRNWGSVAYTERYKTGAEREAAVDKILSGKDEYYNEQRYKVETAWGAFKTKPVQRTYVE